MTQKIDRLGKAIQIGSPVIYTTKNKGIYIGKVSAIHNIMVSVNGYNKNYPYELYVISESEYDYEQKRIAKIRKKMRS